MKKIRSTRPNGRGSPGGGQNRAGHLTSRCGKPASGTGAAPACPGPGSARVARHGLRLGATRQTLSRDQRGPFMDKVQDGSPETGCTSRPPSRRWPPIAPPRAGREQKAASTAGPGSKLHHCVLGAQPRPPGGGIQGNLKGDLPHARGVGGACRSVFDGCSAAPKCPSPCRH